MAEYIGVSIGRNVGETPMSASRWAQFRAEVAALGDLQAVKVGTAEWEGVREDSATLELLVDDLDAIRPELAAIAAKYDQDAVGLWQAELINRS